MLRARLLALLIYSVYRLFWFTWRIRIHEPESMKEALRSGEPMVLAHWHGDELAILHMLARYRACTMVSTSKDGELMAAVIHLLGAKSARGSSTRGGVSALKGILRLTKEGNRPSVAVDGPKGPYHKVKPGVFEISKLTSGRIFPVSAAASKAKVFERAWNKTFLPLPFARIEVVWGNPLPAVSRDQDGRDSALAETLETALANAGQNARNLIAAQS